VIQKMLLPFIMFIFSMVGMLNAQHDCGAPVPPVNSEQEALATDEAVVYEVLLAELKKSDDADEGSFLFPFSKENLKRLSDNGGFCLLSNIEVYFLREFLTAKKMLSILAQPKIFSSFDTKSGIITGNEKSWYEIALIPQRSENSGNLVPTKVTLVRKEVRDGHEEADSFDTPYLPVPDGGTLLLGGTLDDKDVMLFVTVRKVLTVE